MPELTPHPTALSDRYRVERQLGQGGMATVYLAHDTKLDREVALKVLRPELCAVLGKDRFLAEVRITARLDHPHILTLIDSGEADGLFYYVLPFVRGESLRDLLHREKQLGVDQALAITRHIGAALDYAHRQGVVHRDIKPENILLQEGEAMLADFGIALAVKEAGGNRLTETGLSLGTPQYMSPEQATGDRDLDARSDIYSLGAVTYEMLVGNPPMTGATVQAVIAKLLTEQPTRIRTVRNTVPEAVDDAVFRALAKIPADRFRTAGEFVKALDAAAAATGTASSGTASSGTAGAARRWSGYTVGAAIGGVATIVILGALSATGRLGGHGPVTTLRDRTQVTFSGNIMNPVMSADGKQLAYYVQHCAGGDCTYALDLQDVGATATHTIFDGASSIFDLSWSPDRRNLLATMAWNGRGGAYLISALGGPPRFVNSGAAAFWAGGDSLLLGPAAGSDSGFTIRVADLTGTAHDSLRIPGSGQFLSGMMPIPGTAHIASLIIQQPHGVWQVFDRSGKVSARLINSCTCGGTAAHDAIWMTRAGPTEAEAVVRVGVDPSTGRLASHQDTIYSGRFTSASVTADGSQFAIDDGSATYSVVAAGLAAILRGAAPASGTAPLLSASTQVGAYVSPDGGRMLIVRRQPGPKGEDVWHLSVMPYGGGAETPLNVAGRVVNGFWADSTTVVASTYTATGRRYTRLDARTGAPLAASSGIGAIDLPDSAVSWMAPMADGWAWIPRNSDEVVVSRGGARHVIPRPAWYGSLREVAVSPDGRQLAWLGWNASTFDTLRVEVMPLDATGAAGAPTVWFSGPASSGDLTWLADGSIAFARWTGDETMELHQLGGPGRDKRLGRVPHAAGLFTVSADLRRATLGWRDYHADAWLYRVEAR